LGSYIEKLSIPKNAVPIILGKKGSRIQEIRRGSSLRIDVNDTDGDNETSEVVLEGAKDEVLEVKEKILGIVDEHVRQPIYLYFLILSR
jgi:predicted PilT family ATPase